MNFRHFSFYFSSWLFYIINMHDAMSGLLLRSVYIVWNP